MKKCIKCNIEKQFIEFNKSSSSKDGLRNTCKNCRKEYDKKHYENIKEKKQEYYKNNSNKIKQNTKEYRLKNTEYKPKVNKQYFKEYFKKRRLIDPLFKLRCNTRARIIQSIKNNGYSKKSKSYQILGCTFEEFKMHLENQFTKGMNWENQGKWHLDHIYPVSLATDEKHLIQLNHYTNFQPLWAIDNIKKGNKI